MTKRKKLNDGLINMKPRRNSSFLDKYIPIPESGCWIWLGNINNKGYGKYKSEYAHRVSFGLTNIPANKIVMHTCDVPSCINPNHLILGTSKDNVQDMLNKERQASPLTKKDIINIRERKENGEKTKNLAKEYNIDRHTITRITKKHTWKHIS